MLTIESNIPYDALISGWLRLHNVSLDSLVQASRRYGRAYLAWETVRQAHNPFFNIGTGFEGYFVGIHHSIEEMNTELVHMGYEMLANNYRLYPRQPMFIANLMKTLRGEWNESRTVAVWADEFGAVLGKLRCNLDLNYQAYCFQNETYWRVNRLPPMNYRQCENHIQQQYVLPCYEGGAGAKPDFCLNMLKPCDYDAGLVVSTIGRFGHPLLRAFLQEVSR